MRLCTLLVDWYFIFYYKNKLNDHARSVNIDYLLIHVTKPKIISIRDKKKKLLFSSHTWTLSLRISNPKKSIVVFYGFTNYFLESTPTLNFFSLSFAE